MNCCVQETSKHNIHLQLRGGLPNNLQPFQHNPMPSPVSFLSQHTSTHFIPHSPVTGLQPLLDPQAESSAGSGVSVGPTALADPLGRPNHGRPSGQAGRARAVQWVHSDAAAPLSSPGHDPVTGRSLPTLTKCGAHCLGRPPLPAQPHLYILFIPGTAGIIPG